MQVLSIAFRIYFAKLAYNMIEEPLKIFVQATNKNFFAKEQQSYLEYFISQCIPTYSELLQ